MKTLHNPVMLSEVLQVLDPQPGESYLDLTAGYAGHASVVLAATRNYKSSCLCDRDEFAIQYLRAKYPGGEAPRLMQRDFYSSALLLCQCGYAFDLILADFGVSSPQLDMPERGFSFREAGPLDMRMDRSQPLTAAEVVNTYSLPHLTDLLERYGELGKGLSRKVALEIVKSRPLQTTTDLSAVAARCVPRHSKVHPATRVFQAVRIEVNDELGQIEHTLPLLPQLLNKGGRVALITFHSLEDRLVKNFFREESTNGEESTLTVLTKKPIVAETMELGINPRSRSAKLRAAVKN